MWPTRIARSLALTGGSPPRPAPRRRPAFCRPAFRPLVETLEERTVPTGTASVTVLGSQIDQFIFVPGYGVALPAADVTVNLAPGTYEIDTQDRNGVYGTFTIANDLTISGTTGALVSTPAGIGFDLTKLALVNVPAGHLGDEFVVMSGAGGAIAGNGSRYLPPGTYSISTAGWQGFFGTFTVGPDLAVHATTGALIATPTGIDFDLAQLDPVTIGGNNPNVFLGIPGATAGNEFGDTDYLPAGTYDVMTAGGGYDYGTFTVSSSLTITATTGSLVATPTGVGFDFAKLVTVSFLETAPGGFYAIFGVAPGSRTVHLPSGSYDVRTADGIGSYGTFTISPRFCGTGTISATTGALLALPSGIDVDLCKLNAVTFAPAQGVNWGISAYMPMTSGTTTLYMPDGTYSVTISANNSTTTASFSVGPSGLSATQLPQDDPLVMLQLVPCQDDTTTTLTASVSPSLLNQPVTFTANVSAPDGDVPTGTVQFLIDGANFGSPVTLTNGSASITTASLTPGSHSIQAVYGGDSDFLGSTGGLTQSVQYCFDGFLPPLSQHLAFALNRTIPIKWQLCDFNDALITSLGAVSSLQVAPVKADGSLGTPFNPTPAGGTSLRNDGSQYIFNWQTKGLAAGTYQIELTLADGTVETRTLQLTANGDAANAQVADGSDVSAGGTPGHLLGGDLELYVDNGNGALTPDEVARIQDAITVVDALTGPYGVTVEETADPSQAEVTLAMAATSPVGGPADGILGCFDPSTGQITLLQGWNWYAGADPAQIAASQYDFQTTVTHELGHALGLGESGDPTSAMSGTLAPGAALRVLTTADLNIPYDEGGTDAQRAASVSPVVTGTSAASGEEALQLRSALESSPPNYAEVAAPFSPTIAMSPNSATLAEAVWPAGLLGAPTPPTRPAAGVTLVGLPPMAEPVGAHIPAMAATVLPWGKRPPAGGQFEGEPAGGASWAVAGPESNVVARDAFFRTLSWGDREPGHATDGDRVGVEAAIGALADALARCIGRDPGPAATDQAAGSSFLVALLSAPWTDRAEEREGRRRSSCPLTRSQFRPVMRSPWWAAIRWPGLTTP
jgi:hypothetical protein